MSITFELRRSGTFSLKVRPRIPTRAPCDRPSARREHLDHRCATIRADAVVDAAAREDHLGLVAELLRLRRQVVRVDADAVTADQARAELQEVPLRAGRVEHVAACGCPAVEDDRELVHQRDVEVALRVLDDLGGLGDLDRRRAVDAGRGRSRRRAAATRSSVSASCPETTFMIFSNVCSLSPGLMRSGE